MRCTVVQLGMSISYQSLHEVVINSFHLRIVWSSPRSTEGHNFRKSQFFLFFFFQFKQGTYIQIKKKKSFGLMFCYYILKLQLTYIQFIVSSKIDCIQKHIGHCTAVPNNNSAGYKIHQFYFLQMSILWIKMFTFQMNSSNS